MTAVTTQAVSTMQAVVSESGITTSAAAAAAENLSLSQNSHQFLPIQLFSFIILFFFIIAAYFYMKKKTGVIINKIGLIKEVERFYYNPKTFISVVKIGKEVIVLSVNEVNTTLLTKINDEESLEKVEEGVKSREVPVFQEMLNSTQNSFEEIKKKLKKMRQEDNEV